MTAATSGVRTSIVFAGYALVACLACAVVLGSCDDASRSWVNLEPSGPTPPARFGHAMVYASAAEKTVMFGGATDEGSPLNDTWVYDRRKNTWTQLEPLGTIPSPRRNMAAAYHPGEKRIVVFGGLGEDGQVLDDTWEYDVSKNTWTPWIAPRPSLSPSARYGAEMTYDPESGRLILFGGTYSQTSATSYSGQDFNDTWTFDLGGATWTALSPSGDPPGPRPEGTMSMTYNEAGGEMLILAGAPPASRVVPTTGGSGEDWSIWACDVPLSNTWVKKPRSASSPPTSRYYALAAGSASFRLILFGGVDAQGVTQDDTWVYDPAAGTWSMASAGTPDGPEGRVDHAMVHDRTNGSMIMFGGRSARGSSADTPNATWEYRP